MYPRRSALVLFALVSCSVAEASEVTFERDQLAGFVVEGMTAVHAGPVPVVLDAERKRSFFDGPAWLSCFTHEVTNVGTCVLRLSFGEGVRPLDLGREEHLFIDDVRVRVLVHFSAHDWPPSERAPEEAWLLLDRRILTQLAHARAVKIEHLTGDLGGLSELARSLLPHLPGVVASSPADDRDPANGMTDFRTHFCGGEAPVPCGSRWDPRAERWDVEGHHRAWRADLERALSGLNVCDRSMLETYQKAREARAGPRLTFRGPLSVVASNVQTLGSCGQPEPPCCNLRSFYWRVRDRATGREASFGIPGLSIGELRDCVAPLMPDNVRPDVIVVGTERAVPRGVRIVGMTPSHDAEVVCLP